MEFICENVKVVIEYTTNDPLETFKFLEKYVSGQDASELIDQAKIDLKKSPVNGAIIRLKANAIEDNWTTSVEVRDA